MEEKNSSFSDLVAAENRFFSTRRDFVSNSKTIVEELENGLRSVKERGTALRLLIDLDQTIKGKLTEPIFDLCLFSHPEIDLSREIFLDIDRQVTAQKLSNVLEDPPSDWDEEEFRRLAELLSQGRMTGHLRKLLELARSHLSEDVREVAEDFAV